MTNRYLPKFPLHSDETIKGYEVSKIINNVKSETYMRKSKMMIASVVLVASLIVYLFIR